jgi:hypothetical protein
LFFDDAFRGDAGESLVDGGADNPTSGFTVIAITVLRLAAAGTGEDDKA